MNSMKKIHSSTEASRPVEYMNVYNISTEKFVEIYRQVQAQVEHAAYKLQAKAAALFRIGDTKVALPKTIPASDIAVPYGKEVNYEGSTDEDWDEDRGWHGAQSPVHLQENSAHAKVPVHDAFEIEVPETLSLNISLPFSEDDARPISNQITVYVSLPKSLGLEILYMPPLHKREVYVGNIAHLSDFLVSTAEKWEQEAKIKIGPAKAQKEAELNIRKQREETETKKKEQLKAKRAEAEELRKNAKINYPAYREDIQLILQRKPELREVMDSIIDLTDSIGETDLIAFIKEEVKQLSGTENVEEYEDEFSGEVEWEGADAQDIEIGVFDLINNEIALKFSFVVGAEGILYGRGRDVGYFNPPEYDETDVQGTVVVEGYLVFDTEDGELEPFLADDYAVTELTIE